MWCGPIVIKGIHTDDDARRRSAKAPMPWSCPNHGGRQLDGVAATLRVLPEVVDAVGGRIEVLMDGGIRRGSDIVKALCLGARAVLVGRAYAYGLGAAGGAGVTRAIEILRADRRSHAEAARLSVGDGSESVVSRSSGDEDCGSARW